MPSNRKRRIRQAMAESNLSHQAVLNLRGKVDTGGVPLPWLIEKTAIALGEAARLVDLANEPDTNAWYRGALKRSAQAMIARLAPVVVTLCDRSEAADVPKKWEPIVEGGTPALRAWIQRYELEREFGDCVGTGFVEDDDDEPAQQSQLGRDERIERARLDREGANRTAIQARLLRNGAMWLLRQEVPAATRRLLLWILVRLEASEFVDSVTLSRRFLANDIDATSAETAAAYQALCEAGVLELADYLPAPPNEDAFRVRVTLLAENQTKYPRAFVPIEFAPGRKDGHHRPLPT